jgi:hypothetical protein
MKKIISGVVLGAVLMIVYALWWDEKQQEVYMTNERSHWYG